MRLPPFDYLAPASLQEALQAKSRLGSTAAWLAGGTDLLPRAKQGLAPFSAAISLKHLRAQLSKVEVQDTRLIIGALTTLQDAAQHPEVSARFVGLSEALASIGAETMQQRVGTVGGNLCADTRCLHLNQSPAWRSGLAPCFKLGGEVCHPGGATADRCRSVCQSDGAVMLMALGAKALVAGPEGEREIPLAEFFTGQGETPISLGEDELLTGVAIDMGSGSLGSAYQKMALRGAIDYPLVSAGAVLAMEQGKVSQAQVAVGAVFAAPLLLTDAVSSLIGREPTPEALAQVAARAGKHADPFPINNVGAELEWRKDMVAVVVRRALTQAAQRAEEGSP